MDCRDFYLLRGPLRGRVVIRGGSVALHGVLLIIIHGTQSLSRVKISAVFVPLRIFS